LPIVSSVATGERRTTLELVVLLLAVLTAAGFVADMIPALKFDQPAALYGVLGTGIGALGVAAAKGKADSS
jgi:hypothetical protein